jgi:Thioredoxin-like domain/Glutathione S-transferase, C-terminal domain
LDVEDQKEGSEYNSLAKEWDDITKRIEKLQTRVRSLKSQLGVPQSQSVDCGKLNFTIFADPKLPPHSVITLINMLDEKIGVRKTAHCHSSLKGLPDHLKNIFAHQKEGKPLDNNITVIWKSVGLQLEMIVSPVDNVKVTGEVNVLRYLCRILEAKCKDFDWYENTSAETSVQIDHWLDKGHAQLLKGSTDAQLFLKALDAQLNGRAYIVGNKLSPADIFLVSVLSNLKVKMPKNIEKWYQQCIKLRLNVIERSS